MREYKCKLCNEEFNCYDSLRRHTGRTHKINSTTFYVNFNLKGEWPMCKCGCGQKVKWSHQLKSFRQYQAGHQSRIKNNWGHNISAQLKSAETRRQQFKNGERKVWNDKLTKEIDERVKNNGIKSSIGINSNPNELKRRSEFMREQRRNGSLPTLYREQSSQWKGGTSEVNNITRSSKRLYDEWKYPILVRDEFKCKECGNTDKLHIHHDKEPMCEIIKKHMPDMEYITDFELKKSISDKIVDYHIKNNVSGITLCSECHENYHPSLNFT
jgi:hypothetical protein